MTSLQDRIDRGDVIILDGGIGTEIQRQGVPMDDVAWCATANKTHPDAVRKVHEDYIRAGAEVITANTFSTARHVLEVAGLGEETVAINRRAVELAREARDAAADGPVWIAGSLSPMSAEANREHRPSAATARANFDEQAAALAEAGAELLIAEMVMEVEYGGHFVAAAVATGLPVWLGFSCRLGAGDGRVLMFPTSEGDVAFEDVIGPITALGGSVAGVMHSAPEDTQPALKVLKRHWSGPLMAYAESGSFVMPDWQFVDVVSAEAYLDHALDWVGTGVQIVGGCCGIGPEHIRLLKERLPARIGD